jgi:hypothetical protein
MRTHITPRRIHTSDWEFARSYTPRRTAFGVLLDIVCLAVAATVVWLAVTNGAALLTAVGLLALWLMVRGAQR